jgi:hypothetical protein
MARRLIGPSAWLGGAAGVVIGAAAAGLVKAGNPGNMGLCIACFVRDTAGAFGGEALGMGAVAYLRPEILGLLLGAAVAALAAKEFRARGGSAFLVRFVLGFVFMVSALVFLGCTVRAWLRLGGGDLNAAVGIAGLTAGIGAGVAFLRGGFNLGRARAVARPLGFAGALVALLLLALAAAVAAGARPGFLSATPANARATPQGAVVQGTEVLKPAGARLVEGAVVAADGAILSPAQAVARSKPMPGGKRAPLLVSLVAGLLLGALAQRSRFCSVGGIRDAFLVRRFDLLFGVFGLLAGALAVNLALGQFRLGFADQPVAHTDALGNFAAMAAAGLAAVLMGGCPFRQVVMTGEGDVDAAGAVLGMFAGALFAHGTGVASSPKGLAPLAWPALALMAALLVAIALWKRERAPVAAPAPSKLEPTA